MSESTPAGLSDIQKSDLSVIWNVHSTVILTNDGMNGNNGNKGLNSSNNQNNSSLPSVPMDHQSFNWIASLTSYFIYVLNMIADDTIDCSCGGVQAMDQQQQQSESNREQNIFEKFSTSLDAMKAFFPRIRDGSTIVRSNTNRLELKSMLINPIIPRGRTIITIDHASFLNELESYKNDLRGFGAFLYHRPHFALCSISSAICLTLISMNRRVKPITLQDHQSHNNYTHCNLQSIIIHTIFHNVYPTIPIQQVKTSNAYKFITLKGRIIKVHSKRLRLHTADVLCIKCGQHFKHLFHGGRYELPTQCRAAQSSSNKCRGQKFEIVRRTAKYIDYQRLKLQEEDNHNFTNHSQSNSSKSMPAGGAAAGRSPRSIDLEVSHDLVDTCQAGDCVKVVGIVHALNTAVASGKTGRKAASETSTYTLFMVANSIVNTTADLHSTGKNSRSTRTTSSSGLIFTKEQLEKITKVAHADHLYGPLSLRMAFPFDLLVRSLCPSIIGHDCVKAGILLSLLGGTPPSSSGLEDVKCGLSIRSNIHCLIVGDPGMGKSCLLLATQQVAARSVYVGGNTSSTTGLTVSLTKEAAGEIGIEAGALPLADQGVCCIDEFDKMAKNQMEGLLEAMEQQRISIAKAGAICSLPSRCAVIAAANPKQGKYNLNKTVAENLNISSPLLSRFDLVFILRDDANVDHDKLISGNIMNQYRYSHSEGVYAKKRKKNDENAIALPTNEKCEISIKQRLPWVAQTQKPLPADLLKDYISYAREYCKPKMTQEAAAVLKKYFLTLRYPENGVNRNDSVPITTRQLEALIRLSQARAKACLREFVLKEDSEDVVALMHESVNQVHIDNDGRIDKTRGGVAGKSKRKQKKAFVDALRQQHQQSFSKDDFYRVAAHLQLPLNDFWTLVEELRYSDQPEIRKGSDGMYYLL